MNRKKFIQSVGGTCANWTWSWSFINDPERIVIFGQWDIHESGAKGLILSEDWRTSRKGISQPGYYQARKHIRLVEEKGYQLKTFPMVWSPSSPDDATAPSRISSFLPMLTAKQLAQIGNSWYATDESGNWTLPEEVEPDTTLLEGAISTVTINAYERNAMARASCLQHFGYDCRVCGFSFEKRYGPIGHRYIHVHHIFPLAEIKHEYTVDPLKDLIPVCPNCHAMIHATRPAQTVDQLRGLLGPSSEMDAT